MTTQQRNPSAEDILNHIFSITQRQTRRQTRRKTGHFYFPPPENWPGTIYRFAYTPWKTRDPETRKIGFWTLKYKYLKTTKKWKLVKKIRFGRRKIAHKRALEWYEKHYGQKP